MQETRPVLRLTRQGWLAGVGPALCSAARGRQKDTRCVDRPRLAPSRTFPQCPLGVGHTPRANVPSWLLLKDKCTVPLHSDVPWGGAGGHTVLPQVSVRPGRGLPGGGDREPAPSSHTRGPGLSCSWPACLSSRSRAQHTQASNFKRWSCLLHLLSFCTHTHTHHICAHTPHCTTGTHTTPTYTCTHTPHTRTLFPRPLSLE